VVKCRFLTNFFSDKRQNIFSDKTFFPHYTIQGRWRVKCAREGLRADRADFA
jgi:hypothetical protein